MKKDCLLQRKPIHLGLLLFKSGGITYILTETQKTVFFKSENVEYKRRKPIILNEYGLEEEYYLFQYIEDNKEEVDCIGLLEEFTLVEDIYYHAIDTILDNNINYAIIKAEYYNEVKFYYYVNSDYTIMNDTISNRTDLRGEFTTNENILLNYIFRKKIKQLDIETFLAKKKEITEYVYSLDILSIIEDYKIQRLEHYRTKLDLYSTEAAGLRDTKDKYLDYLLPEHFTETWYKGNIYDPVPKEARDKILECIANEKSIKELAKTNYSREEHIDYILYEYIKKVEKEREKYNRKFIIPKLVVWDTKYKREE